MECDIEKAKGYYYKAAEAGSQSAKINISLLHSIGLLTDARIYSDAKEILSDAPLDHWNLAGKIYYDAGDYEKAFMSFEKSHRMGNPTGTANLSMMYFEGCHVEKNMAKFFELTRSAAARGYPKAVSNLGVCHINGISTPMDAGKAFICFRKAARLGELDAFGHLALMYFKGIHVSKDNARGIEILESALALGDFRAAIDLASIYAYGKHGVPMDYEKAVGYFLKPAERGNADAQYRIGSLYVEAKDYAKAASWFERAADSGNADALNSLGMMHVRGLFFKRDIGKGEEYLAKAAEKGSHASFDNLIYMYKYGKLGVPKDPLKAAKWIELAAKRGVLLGMSLYAYGCIERKDYAGAFEYFSRAAKGGDANAMAYLGLMHIEGMHVKKDEKTGVKYMEMAAMNGNLSAQSNLSSYYLEKKKDYANAFKWASKAAEKEDPAALGVIGRMYKRGLYLKKDATLGLYYLKKAAEKGGDYLICEIADTYYSEEYGMRDYS